MTLPRIIAHRCGGALAPENSLAGLDIAARLGCRGVEFDVMLTADGVPVLMHDETLLRTVGVEARLADTALAELRRFDAGGHHHPAFAVSPAPTLAEALARCAALNLWTNVEIKPSVGREVETGEAVARMLAALDDPMWIRLSSFSMAALIAASAIAPRVPRALLFDQPPLDWASQAQRMGAVAMHCAAAHATASLVQEAQAKGLSLACYTVNRRGDGDALLAMGVSALFTDRPDLWSASEM